MAQTGDLQIDDFIDVGKSFIKWFEYGFIIVVLMFFAVLIITISYACKSGSGLGLGACLFSLVICGFKGLMLAGSVFRWSRSGKSCSGAYTEVPVGTTPYLVESGRLLWYFLTHLILSFLHYRKK